MIDVKTLKVGDIVTGRATGNDYNVTKVGKRFKKFRLDGDSVSTYDSGLYDYATPKVGDTVRKVEGGERVICRIEDKEEMKKYWFTNGNWDDIKTFRVIKRGQGGSEVSSSCS